MSPAVMKAAKSIDELFEEVKAAGCDLVVTNDAPLATALNTRIDMPQVGPFAYTARQIAGLLQYRVLGRSVLSDVEIVRRIQGTLAEEGKIWAFSEVYNEVLNIREIRKYTSRVEDYLHGRGKTIYSVFSTLETREALQNRCDDRIMEEFYRGRKVAVIAPEDFDQLDRHMLPPIGTYTEIDPMKHGTVSVDRIYAIGNDRQVAESVVDLIKPSKASDVAIVIDPSGPMADAVRAALYTRHIPFKNKLSVRDVPSIRDYLQFVTLALSFETLRVSDVRIMFQSFGADGYCGLKTKFDNNLLENIMSSGILGEDFDERSSELITAMGSVRSRTFEEVRRMLDRRGSMSSMAIQLESMGLSDHKVNAREVGDLVYAVSNIQDLRHNEQIPDYEKKGVLLADCKNSVYIDRPFVIYVGMADDWDMLTPGKPYIDYEDLDEYIARRQTVLLQQGQTRIYAVKPYTEGKDTIPCGTFETVFGTRISSFADICGAENIVRGSWAEERQSGTEGSKDIGIPDVTLSQLEFSQSTYRKWRQCPLSFMFWYVLPFGSGEDNGDTVYGSLVHEFAEAAFSYPEEFLRNDPEFYVDKLMALYAPISDPVRKEIDRTRFLTHVKKILLFVEMVKDDVPGTYREPKAGETFRFLPEEKTMVSDAVESKEHLESPPMMAKYDIAYGNTIYDLKTGRAKKCSDVVSAMDVFDPKNVDNLDVQALFYLYVRARKHGDLGERTTFTLFFLNKDPKDSRDYLRGQGVNNFVNVRYETDMEGCVIRQALINVEKKKNQDMIYKLQNDREHVTKIMHEIFDKPKNIETAKFLLTNLGIKTTKNNITMASNIVNDLQHSDVQQLNDTDIVVSREMLKKLGDRVNEDSLKARRGLAIPFYSNPRGKRSCNRCDYRKMCVTANEIIDVGGDGNERSQQGATEGRRYH